MKKFLAVALSAAAVALSAVESATHIMVSAQGSLEIRDGGAEGAATLKPSSSDKTGKQKLQILVTAKDKISTVKFSVIPNADGKIQVRVFSARQKWGGKSTGVANFTVNGTPVKNSDYAKLNAKTGLPTGFSYSIKPLTKPDFIPAADGEPAMLRSSSQRSVGVTIPVKADECYVISVDIKGLDAYPNEVEAYKKNPSL